jgi:hypothetical protein
MKVLNRYLKGRLKLSCCLVFLLRVRRRGLVTSRGWGWSRNEGLHYTKMALSTIRHRSDANMLILRGGILGQFHSIYTVTYWVMRQYSLVGSYGHWEENCVALIFTSVLRMEAVVSTETLVIATNLYDVIIQEHTIYSFTIIQIRNLKEVKSVT